MNSPSPLESQSVLTPREHEVLGLLRTGRSNKEIAAILRASTRTVDTHVRHIFAKLRVANRVEAAVYYDGRCGRDEDATGARPGGTGNPATGSDWASVILPTR